MGAWHCDGRCLVDWSVFGIVRFYLCVEYTFRSAIKSQLCVHVDTYTACTRRHIRTFVRATGVTSGLTSISVVHVWERWLPVILLAEVRGSCWLRSSSPSACSPSTTGTLRRPTCSSSSSSRRWRTPASPQTAPSTSWLQTWTLPRPRYTLYQSSVRVRVKVRWRITFITRFYPTSVHDQFGAWPFHLHNHFGLWPCRTASIRDQLGPYRVVLNVQFELNDKIQRLLMLFIQIPRNRRDEIRMNIADCNLECVHELFLLTCLPGGVLLALQSSVLFSRFGKTKTI